MPLDFEFSDEDDDSLNFLFDDGELHLVFSQEPLTESPLDLVFGEDDSDLPSLDPVELRGDIALPPLTFESTVRSVVIVVGDASLPTTTFASAMEYQTRTDRPIAASVETRWQIAKPTNAAWDWHFEEGRAISRQVESPAQDGMPVRVDAQTHWQDGAKVRRSTETRFEEGVPVRRSAETKWQDGIRVRRSATTRFQEGVPVRRSAETKWQDGIKRRTQTTARWQEAVPVRSQFSSRAGHGLPLSRSVRTRFQEAMKPPPGKWIKPVIPPVEEPCYTPPEGNAVHLLFSDLWDGGTDLVFVCDNHQPPEPGETIVVPVKKVYLVLNTATLVRVSSGTSIPTLSMSMSLDVDSWTWTFSASVPGLALSAVEPTGGEPTGGEPVEVEATVNGVPYRFIVESISRERTFGQSSLRIGGRGKSALLDAPYAPVMNFGNTAARTAQQLMNDVLMDNGVPLGWEVEWNPDDWTVPAKVFSHSGSYISALNAIAGSIGAYLQPDNVDDKLRVLLRYPTEPWHWDTVTPDYELPVDVTTRESIEWVEKPRYDRVWVSGQQDGKQFRVTAPGAEGLILAPSVTDPLLTATAAGRQRGISILSDTGRIATVGLRLPVLNETGIIPPGKFVRYVDGGITRLGITRSVNVDVGMPEIWQNISVETHE